MSGQADQGATVYWCVDCGPILRVLCEDGTHLTLHPKTEEQHRFAIAVVDEEHFPTQ